MIQPLGKRLDSKRTPRLPAALLVLALCALLGGSAFGSGGPGSLERGRARTSLKIAARSQTALLEHGLVVNVRSTRKRVKLRVGSSTFDRPRMTALAKPRKVKLPKSGSKTVRLRLSKGSRAAIRRCEAREIQVRALHSKTTVKLVRDTGACKPKRVDLGAADRCDFIGDQGGSLCLMPFPDDYYTVNDSSTRTGKRIDLKTTATPKNESGEPIEAAPYNLNDGFSPGQTMVVKIPGLDTPEAMAKTNPVGLDELGEYTREDAPVVVIDAATKERWPIWVELDSKATTPARTALLIHPARNFDSGHRYVVAVRHPKGADGSTLPAPAGFRYFRDELPSKKPAIKSQRDRFERVFKNLRAAGIKRSNLYLAWDFTVASDENIAARVLHMRDESFAQLGDTSMADLTVQGGSPAFTITQTTNYTIGQDPNMARKVEGTFQVPCYLSPGCEVGTLPNTVPSGTFQLGADGLPQRSGTFTARFVCMIPRSAVGATPQLARPSLYGHGLLGGADETVSDPQKTLGNAHGFVFCGTDELGLSSNDAANALSILQNLSKFPQLADRLQQGLLDELFLGRLMLHPSGFASSGAFRVNGTTATPPVIDPQRLYYDGNSQGAIEGGALTAISPDVTRGALGVGGMNYSVLLDRSVDFDGYVKLGLEPAYADELERPLVLSLVQMLWDRGESNGYAHRLSTSPLPNTPPHEVLMNVAFGDHQVSNFTADTMARTIGAKVHDPVVYPGRWPDVASVFGVPRISSYPYTGSALVYWDSGPIRPNPSPGGVTTGPELGTSPPPIPNVPNRAGQDPHELPRRTPAEQRMVSDFLRPEGQSQITDACAGQACFDYTFSGP